MRQDAGQERSFYREVFGDGFNDPVAAGELGQVVVEVAGSDEAGQGGLEEGCRLGLEQRFDGPGSEFVAGERFAGRDDIEQQDGDSGVGQVGGDAGAHCARAEDGGAANEHRARRGFLR